jgi:phosphoglycerate dehydrogenase-like enzyme
MKTNFKLALTADFYRDGNLLYRDIGLDRLDAEPGVSWHALEQHQPLLGADQLAGVNGVIVLTPKVDAATVAAADDLLALVRFGVGYDSVDVQACTQAGVLACITAGAVDRSVAEATVGWMLALTHQVKAKDRLVRQGRWDERSGYMGAELRQRRFGTIGLGGIARETLRLLSIFGMESPLAYDPFADEAEAAAIGVELVELDELLRRADFVSVHCPLTEQTSGLLDRDRLALMKKGAYLINTARGGIVDEVALYELLASGHLAGAALDCFAVEPVVEAPPFAELDNVLLAPHAIAWTDELFRDIGRAACDTLIGLARGRRPAKGVLNPELFEDPSFIAKWRRLQVD